MGIDFRRLAVADGEYVEPEESASLGQPPSCSYCGSTEFADVADHGRGLRATCAACGGTMTSAGATGYWQPELIGSPKNHPKMNPDPGAAGPDGRGIPIRIEDLSDRQRIGMPSRRHPVPEGVHYTDEGYEPGTDEHSDLDYHNPGWDHRILRAHLPARRWAGYVEYSVDHQHDGVNPGLKVNLMGVAPEHQHQGVASAMQDHLRSLYPTHVIDHGGRTKAGQNWWNQYQDPAPHLDVDNPLHPDHPFHEPQNEGLDAHVAAADWCRHRHAGHCWLPRNDTNGATAFYVPQDRGVCPWTTASQQQINCPVSEPGPMAGMSMAGARQGLPEGAEFHFTPAQPDRRTDHHELAMHADGGEVGKLIWGHDGDISGVDTHHRYRRRGIATALYTKAHELSAQRGIAPPGGSVFQTGAGHAFRSNFNHMGERPDVSEIPTQEHRGKGENDTDLHHHLVEHHYQTSSDLVHSWDHETAQRVHDNITQFDPCGWKKTSMIGDPELRMHMTATWADVRQKAKRIRAEGGVNVVVASGEGVNGHVQGDTAIYETQLNYVPGTAKVGFWTCGCAWAAYAWGRSPAYRRFEGRMCSHALALQFEAQARGMFGRTVEPDAQRPDWLRQRTPVQVEYDRDSGQGRTRRAVPPANMRRTFEGSLTGHSALDPEGVYPTEHGLELNLPPVYAFVVDALSQGADPVEAMTAALAAGMPHTAARDLVQRAVGDPAAEPAAAVLEALGAKQDPDADAPTHAGLVLKADDTGRILMLQRSMEDEDDPARGTWEFPGGGIEDHDSSSLHGAAREFAEEVGQRVPHGGTLQHVWRSGPYVGHVLVIPREDQIALHDGRVVTNPDDPGGDHPEQAVWWDPDHARKNPALREECKTSPWKAIKAATRGQAVNASLDAFRRRIADYAAQDPLGDFVADPPAQRPNPIPGNEENPGSTGFATAADPPAFDAADPRTMRMPEMSSWGAYSRGNFLREIIDRYRQPHQRPPLTGGEWPELPEFGDTAVALHVVTSMNQPRRMSLPDIGNLLSGQHDDQSPVATRQFDLDQRQLHYVRRNWDEVREEPLTVRTLSNGHPFELADGHHRWTVAHEMGERSLPVRYISMGEDHRQAFLNDAPEPALPSTTADEDDGWTSDGVDPAHQHIPVAGGPLRPDPRDDMQPEINPTESIQPNQVHASAGPPAGASVAETVAWFQTTAAGQKLAADSGSRSGVPGSTTNPTDGDIAAAARAMLSKTALKDFNAVERAELIGEGADGIRARNLDQLDIEGTHYARLDAALAEHAQMTDTEALFV